MRPIRLIPQHAGTEVPTLTLTPGDSKVVGRSAQADIQIDDISLSRRHVQLSLSEAGELAAVDLGSTNGIFVNGVQQRNVGLSPADHLTIGAIEFLYEDESGRAPRPVLPPMPAFESMTRLAIAPDAPKRID